MGIPLSRTGQKLFGGIVIMIGCVVKGTPEVLEESGIIDSIKGRNQNTLGIHLTILGRKGKGSVV